MDSQADQDQGDISLALAAVRTPTHCTSTSHPAPAIDSDVAVLQPKRLFLEPQRTRGASPVSFVSSATSAHSRNDSPTVFPSKDNSDDGATTPESTSRKFWDGKASDVGPRPSSAQPLASKDPPEASISPFPAQPLARRTPSSLGRSRSLNVHMPSADKPHRQLGSSPIPTSATSVCPTPSDKIGWTRHPGEPRPPPLMSEDVARKMGRWVKEIVVCNFDLERGPVVERRAGGRRWGFGEKENV